jgi:microsomal dipeptidase-like Zn-dependent dipeptidase
MAQPAYFDFHFHPVFKQFISRYEETYPSGRAPGELTRPMDLRSDLMDLADAEVLHILESQCCLEQMQKGGVRLGIANVVAIEHGIADSQGFIAKLLKSDWTRPMDPRYMKSIRLGEVSYYRMFIKELDLYRTLAKAPHIRFLTRKNPVTIDGDQLFIALGMEGGHNLSRVKVAKPSVYDRQLVNGNGPAGALYEDFCKPGTTDVGASLKRLQQALWDEGMDLCYLTLTHLSHIIEQPLATHAFGMKMLQHPAFYPVGNGITPLGLQVIDAAYTLTVNNGATATPLIIDIKHMGLKSRQDLYEYRRSKPQYAGIPIIASHMGVTGYSLAEWVDALTKSSVFSLAGIRAVEIMTRRKKAGEWGSGLNDEFTFNPWSINLMDEDIVEVLHTGGLIGVSLDVRILGFQAKIGASAHEQSEFVSVPDFKTFFPDIQVRGLVPEPLESMETVESWLIPTKEERHPLCLCFNLLHIVAVAKANKAEIGSKMTDPWRHICIGSDFDGLIDPVKICRDASKMPDLEKVLLKWLPIAEKAYRQENGGPNLLPATTKGAPDLDRVREVVRQIMFENGKAFLQHWVKGDFQL